MGIIISMYGVSLWDDENVLNVDNDDYCTT